MTLARLLVTASAALALTTVPADAATVTIGSDLAAPAEVAEAFPVDTAYWPDKLASAATVTVPVKGQAILVRLKGTAVPTVGAAAPLTLIHFQTLRPQRDGSMKVIVTSEDFHAPTAGDPNQVSEYRSAFLCVEPGDRIAFSHTGGFAPPGYASGVPFRVFGRVPGSVTNRFTGADQDNNGDVLRPTEVQVDRELLMQVVIGSGPNARPACGGTSSSPTPSPRPISTPSPTAAPPATIPRPRRTPRVRRDNTVRIGIFCHGPGSCRGTLTLRSRGRRVAGRAFSVEPRSTGHVRMKLTQAGRRLLRRGGGKLRVTATAEVRGAMDRRTLTIRRST